MIARALQYREETFRAQVHVGENHTKHRRNGQQDNRQRKIRIPCKGRPKVWTFR